MIDVVGIGDGGEAELSPQSRALVMGARTLLGGRRHLDLVPDMPGQTRRPWPSPLREGLAALLTEVHAADAPIGHVVALASGDPLRSGIGTTLIDLLGAGAVRVHPGLSSETLARARMGWSAEQTTVVTLVGRSPDGVCRHLAPGAHLVVLCSDGNTPGVLARLLTQRGWGASLMTAWWHLGGAAEGSLRASAAGWSAERTADLVLVCVEVSASSASPSTAAAVGPAPGRPEASFEHDGQISKRDVRASALAHLRPTPGGHLWDLGAGSGAVGIEWALAAPGASVSAVEHNVARAERIRSNAREFGVVSEVTVVESASIDALADLPDPDAVFVGGGLSPALIDAVRSRLRPGGRLVAHAVTLSTEALLVGAQERFGGELTRISIERATCLGAHVSWTPSRAVVQWSSTKGMP
ncbi:precorrin-6Y C5,15-methyltransferase (decarboxylating) subunit CbiT [Allobranchiibius sp. GilTou73]|uniref:precorrin-6Y C5,15-methyltransferase (decarboxylating) subunit CbiT n=1 Tax=Allobranchiibius sp. GilTou73 TaxID=2904523 RepID=UPI001F2A76DD|nr:precorrin-6Y C5,15-methyltransferase (decarboxylating) subunit CbiT [Allobranchiibius sp. GilTou73]UIJ35199.1 precorrin-6Y C5,15-methyltransferase (decarboxylating) subunit CbiT [Allobranchiibius sp. GilTou73]